MLCFEREINCFKVPKKVSRKNKEGVSDQSSIGLNTIKTVVVLFECYDREAQKLIRQIRERLNDSLLSVKVVCLRIDKGFDSEEVILCGSKSFNLFGKLKSGMLKELVQDSIDLWIECFVGKQAPLRELSKLSNSTIITGIEDPYANYHRLSIVKEPKEVSTFVVELFHYLDAIVGKKS